MKTLFASILLLPLSAGLALADTSDRAVFVPLADTVQVDAEGVHRAQSSAVVLEGVPLKAAEVADVDVNRDGKISFAELLLHDLESDF